MDDDSDTSDDESDVDDGHPDPYPCDPDFTGWSANQLGGYFYQTYKHYKKKWRNFQGARKPSGRRLARPRGQTGRMRRRTTFAVQGRPKRGNPIGRDGQPLKCHGCGSTEHLQASCPHQRRTPTTNAVAEYEFASLSSHAGRMQQLQTVSLIRQIFGPFLSSRSSQSCQKQVRKASNWYKLGPTWLLGGVWAGAGRVWGGAGQGCRYGNGRGR